MKTKRCTKCDRTKPLEEFSKNRSNKDGFAYWCKSCMAVYHKKYFAAHKEARATYMRAYNMLYNHGITLAEYNKMLETQGGVCAICGRPQEKEEHLAVDHDHETGEVRGLLCDPCNVGLGCFQDNPARLHSAADYIVRMLNKEQPDEQSPTA